MYELSNLVYLFGGDFICHAIIIDITILSSRNSPVRYPSALYSGPPIPLDYGDSSDNHSPNKTSRHR